MFDSIINVLLVVFAFGFVIFWHELGHFLAARWAGVRVEQFAVGMGQALVSWRKGIGFRMARIGKRGFLWGNTQDEFDRLVNEEHAKRNDGRAASELSIFERYEIAKKIGLGETEYRLSWVPLGGYVKPTGQDDLRPAAEVGKDDPHAFGAKPVGKRMVIIAAGVVMNVILAFALYVALFMHGFNAPATVVGFVSPGSPAQKAGIQVGDRIMSINGNAQEDYTKIQMNVSLLRDDEPATFLIDRQGTPVTLQIQPVKTRQSYNMPAIGVMPASVLKAAPEKARGGFVSPADIVLPAGSVITHINGQPVSEKDTNVLDQAIQAYDGKPIELTILKEDKSVSSYSLTPMLRLDGFGGDDLSIAGLRPRVGINSVAKDSPAEKAGVKAGDSVEQIAIVETAEALRPPSPGQFLTWIEEAGKKDYSVRLHLLRDGKSIDPIDIKPSTSTQKGRKTIGVGPSLELGSNVAGEVLPGSPADKAGIKSGDRVLAIDGTPVTSWPQILVTLRNAKPGDLPISIQTDASQRDVSLRLGDSDIETLAALRYIHDLPLDQYIEPRVTTNPLTAMSWGVTETKFSIIQVYLTLQRLVQGTVPVSNLSGPLGIFTAGTSAADRGMDYLIWFTALISANLAVVNFLPIPIVDGGLFIFLLAEKITGKPPSPRVQTAAQLFGLVLLGSLFLFVTYHDVLRSWG